MKDEYFIVNRYGHQHKFEKLENTEDIYHFSTQDEDMRIGVTFTDKERKNIKFIDPDGGPIISRNWTDGSIEVVDIFLDNRGLTFKLKEI